MSQAYELIQTVTVGASSASTIEFNNIPQNYSDLKIVISGRFNTLDDANLFYRFNSSTTNFSYRNLRVFDSTIASFTSTNNILGVINRSGYTANTFSNNEIYIPAYNSSQNKSFSVDAVTENNNTNSVLGMWSGLWSNTAPITSISFYGAPFFSPNTTATLYGIGRSRATGGTITADSLYTYHTFTSSGTFMPLENIKNSEVLVIAGGGGGGSSAGGGGGAGGLAYKNGINFIAGSSYTTTIGAGATATTTDGANGNNGNNSTFMSIVANGGGGGAHANAVINGGSGGGAGYFATASGGSATQTSSSISIGYGNAGGTNNRTGSGPPYPCAGGGGAGSVGGNCTESAGGVGGLGTTLFSSWGLATNTGENVSGTYYYAGGGGGSRDGSTALGGFGGGGRGGTVISGGTGIAPIAGTANTGGGGGGGIASGNYSGGSRGGVGGGSGIVIVRYPNF
jgi:hypothetical protein